MSRKIILNVGDTFNKFTVLDNTLVYKNNPKLPYLLCRCECGVEKLVDKGKLQRREVKSW